MHLFFYIELFGWKSHENPHTPVDYLRVKTGKTAGGMMKRPACTTAAECRANVFVCSFDVNDFDVTMGKIALPKFAIPITCRQGNFRILRETFLDFF